MNTYRIAISETCAGSMAETFPKADVIDIRSGRALAEYFGDGSHGHTLLILKPVSAIDPAPVLTGHTGAIIYSSLQQYTPGSVRDDFDLGHAVIIDNQAAARAAQEISRETTLAGFYDLRLQLSRLGDIERVDRFYETTALSKEDLDKAHFAYCDPRNRAYQIEAEQVFTKYLRQTGGYIEPTLEGIPEWENSSARYKYTASVIIPVKDRPEVIADAIRSAATQKTDFAYNVIVVDNQSQQATRDILNRCKSEYANLHVIETTEPGLGIGGCWNIGIQSPECGAIAVQLDSDDVYSSENTLQQIVDVFRSEHCGVLIGSYRLTDIDLKPLNDIIIDHREYTQENGVNNALRVNGFGAPRCYLTELVRKNPFRNVSYGEDYDLCLRLSRQYKVSRIYDVLYFCRRWGKNSDSNLTPEKLAAFNLQKDTFRSQELELRRML